MVLLKKRSIVKVLWMIQTPQAFRFDIIRRGRRCSRKDSFLGTDEAMLVERLGHPVHIVESSYENVKMTTKEDLVFGEAILAKPYESLGGYIMFRVGQGFDVHAFAEGRPLIIRWY